jgi:hypothetical protein
VHKLIKTVAVAAVALGLITLPSAAQASNPEPVASAKAVEYATYPLKKAVVGNGQMSKNAVDWLQLGAQARAHIVALENKAKAAEARAVAAENKADDALARPDKGTEAASKSFDQATVEKIGGPFAANATLVGTITLPKGTLKVDADGFWTTLAAGPNGTRPQLALRGTGVSVTIFPGEASTAKDRELTGHATKKVVLTEATEVKVYAFGYNDDTSDAGAGRLAVTVDILATYL